MRVGFGSRRRLGRFGSSSTITLPSRVLGEIDVLVLRIREVSRQVSGKYVSHSHSVTAVETIDDWHQPPVEF